jgi:hypothetical protein
MKYQNNTALSFANQDNDNTKFLSDFSFKFLQLLAETVETVASQIVVTQSLAMTPSRHGGGSCSHLKSSNVVTLVLTTLELCL